MLQDSDERLSRGVLPVHAPMTYVVPTKADPSFASVALLNQTGELVDSRERYRSAQPLPTVSLHPAAVAEAFDYTASVWKYVFGERLLMLRTTSAPAALSMPVETRSDFESRLSSVSALMKAISVPDSLLSPSDIGIDQSHSIERMKAALRNRLSDPDLEKATTALGVFAQVNDVRVALQAPGCSAGPAGGSCEDGHHISTRVADGLGSGAYSAHRSPWRSPGRAAVSGLTACRPRLHQRLPSSPPCCVLSKRPFAISVSPEGFVQLSLR
jgi:hypothetical protein